MGLFSWIYADTGKPMRYGVRRNSYLLIPEEFGGGHFITPCYDGYGHFENRDVYEQAALWNREYISTDVLKSPDPSRFDLRDKDDKVLYENACRRYEKKCRCLRDFRENVDDESMIAGYGGWYLRDIGINIAGTTSKNAALHYPIKITTKPVPYDSVGPSANDPEQGR